MRGVLLGVATITLVACGNYTARNAFSIDLTDTGLFAPATLRAPLGASVTFRNAGTQPREVYYQAGDVRSQQSRPKGAPNLTPNSAAPANAPAWRSGAIYPGEAWTHTFAKPGAYLFESPYAAGFTDSPNTQVPAGVITVETVRAGEKGDTASDPSTNPPYPTPAAPPGGND